MKLVLRLALATTALTVALPAIAADYDPPIYVPEVEEYTPVEVGSGWYLRGDVSYHLKDSFKDSSIAVDESLFDNDLLGEFGPVDLYSLSERKVPVSGSIGAGYHFNDWIRADVNLGFLGEQKFEATGLLRASDIPLPSTGCLGTQIVSVQNFDDEGDPDGAPIISTEPDWRENCSVEGSGRSSSWNGLANAYVDLGTVAGLTPYVGAGVGMMYNRTKFSASGLCEGSVVQQGDGDQTTTTTFLCRGQDEPDDADVEYDSVDFRDAQYNLMYALNAGVSYQVSKNVSLDFGYQYINSPGMKQYYLTEDGIESRKGYDSHNVKVGFRYDLW